MSGRRVVVEGVLRFAVSAPFFAIGIKVFVPYDLKAAPAEWMVCSSVIAGATLALAELLVKRWWSGAR